jgi:hypothetical protein
VVSVSFFLSPVVTVSAKLFIQHFIDRIVLPPNHIIQRLVICFSSPQTPPPAPDCHWLLRRSPHHRCCRCLTSGGDRGSATSRGNMCADANAFGLITQSQGPKLIRRGQRRKGGGTRPKGACCCSPEQPGCRERAPRRHQRRGILWEFWQEGEREHRGEILWGFW